MDPLERKIAEAEAKFARAAKYAALSPTASIPDDWQEVTERILEAELAKMRPPQISTPEADFHGPGGIRLRIHGVSGGYLVTAIIVLAITAATVAAAWVYG